LSLILNTRLRRNALKGSAEPADKPSTVAKILWLNTRLMVNPVTISAEDNLSASMAVEAIPVMPLVGQHVFCWKSVCILFYSCLVTLSSNLLMKFHQVVFNCKVEQSLRGLLVKFIVSVHIPRKSRQGWDLFLCPYGLYAVPYYLGLIWVAHPSDLAIYHSNRHFEFSAEININCPRINCIL